MLDREFDEGKHPRDDHGRWTDGGGGSDSDGEISASSRYDSPEKVLGADINHPHLETFKAAVDRGVWDFSVKNVRTSGSQKITTFQVTPKIPGNWKSFERPITGTIQHYDPQRAHVNEDGYVTPIAGKGSGDNALPKQGEPGIIYRGMSYEEYQSSMAAGEFKSIGGYNIGEEEKGLTYFSSEPSQAASYAHGFAPWPYIAVPGKPAVIVAVADPGGHIVASSRPTELGINKPIPTSELRAVYFGDAIIASSGRVDIVQESGRPPSEGSRFSPSTAVEWRKEDQPKSVKVVEHPGQGYSKEAYVKDGRIHTSSVYDAARALHENRKVELDQPRTLSTLITHLGKVANDMKARGEAAPNYNLCNVSIKGTNLFCADSKDIPRPVMPQLDEAQTIAFRQHLKDIGYKEVEVSERSDFLRATQQELNGVKVARIADLLRSQTWPQEKRLVVSRDNYILDGHHLWAAQVANDAEDGKLGDARTDIARVDIDIITLLDEAKKFGAGTEPENRGLRRIYVRSSLVEAHRLIAKIEASGDIEIVPYDGEYIPGTELVDLREWDESLHPRDDAGRFGFGGGGGDSSETVTTPIVEGGNVHEKLEKLGVTSTPQAKEWLDKHWDTMGVTPEKFKELVSGGLPTQSVNLGVFIPRGSLAVDVVYQNKMGYFSYDMMPKGGTVHADVLRVRPEGSGFGKKVMANVVELFKRNGNTKIELYANIKVGAYAWAKYGFVPSAKQWKDLQQIYEARASFLPEADQARINKILTINDPRAIWAVADDPRGGDMMLGENLGWDGHIDLGDDQAMRRFNAYIATRPKEAQ